MHKLDNLSIVITTLGGNVLSQTLDIIYNDLDKNSDIEVLITIPLMNKLSIDINKYFNLKIIKTYFPGQVNQRINGFIEVTKEFVLQLDDDVEISSKDILMLKNKLITLNDKSAISPVFFNKLKRNDCIYKLKNSNMKNFFKNIITLVICKSRWGIQRSGTLTILGTNYGVDIESFQNNDLIGVDWLPGGCILHYKKNLHIFDYFPFKGKAYCEDLIHSSIMQRKKIKLHVFKNSKCYTDIPLFPKIRKEKIKFIRAYNYYYFKFRKFNIRFLVWTFVNLFRLVI